MREIQYKDFSLATHKKNWRLKRPNVCQFELTFKCDLHCKHCYSDCYNEPSYAAHELKTEDVKLILDKVRRSGVIWLCFTGGDPLTRGDFLEIYSYAKHKGFIVTTFTTGFAMTEKIADFLKKHPPFVIEITLNAVTKETYEKITQVPGSYEKTIEGIEMMVRHTLPLKIKTQVTRDNFEEKESIKKFVEELGLIFRPSILLYPRLNKDRSPCDSRISPGQVFSLNGKKEADCMNDDNKNKEASGHNGFLFPCAVGGGDGFHIDPYGNMFLCNLMRRPSINLLSDEIDNGLRKLSPIFYDRKFTTDSKCRRCTLRYLCYNCPGKALLETGDMEAHVEYFCELAKATLKNKESLVH